MAFKPDSPITSSIEDSLNRVGFSDNFAKALISYRLKESIVIGFYGRWGSGKTSVLNMLEEKIIGMTNDWEEAAKPIIFNFNPWNYSGQKQLISQFLKELSHTLKRTDNIKTFKKAGEKLELLSKMVAPLSLIPVISPYAELAIKISKSGSDIAKTISSQHEEDLPSLLSEINELLLERNNKIIITIDDIDRLSSEEIRQIFQMVKTIGDLANTVYILSFDKEVVVKALEKIQEGNGEDYLEKIIQVPLQIPTPSKSDIEKVFIDKLNFITEGLPLENFDQNHWTNLYHSGIKHFLHTLRDVNRLNNTLSLGLSMISDEVNFEDYVAVTSIQLFLPDVYEGIKENKDIFVGATSGLQEMSKSSLQNRYKEITDNVKSYLTFDLDDFLERLFPKIKSFLSNTSYGSDWLSEWRKNRRICSPDYFDIYFTMTLSSEDIPRQKLKQIFKSVCNIEEFRTHIDLLRTEGKFDKFLDRLTDYRDEIAFENLPVVIGVLFDIGDILNDENRGFFGISTSSRVNYVISHLLKNLPSQNLRFKVLKEGLSFVKDSICIPVRFVGLLGQEQGKYSEDKNINSPALFIVSNEDLSDLEKILATKIEDWIETNGLLSIRDLPYVLEAWRRWDESSSVKISSTVNSSIESVQGLVNFVSKFLHEVQTQSGDNLAITLSWDINIDYLGKFVDMESVTRRFREINKTINDFNFNKKQLDTISTFLDVVEGKNDSSF